MYIQSIFEECRASVLHNFMQENPFGALTVLTEEGLQTNHLPFELVPGIGDLGTLRAHVSRANPVWQLFDSQVLPQVVFLGPHAYVSPTWFPSRHTHGKVAPSWNYAVVHAHGELRVQQDPTWLHNHLAALSTQQEAGRTDPWHLGEAPVPFTAKMIEHLVGLEISITRLIGKFQLGQQYREADRQGVIDGMSCDANPMCGIVANLIRQANTQP